jgi:hypothetical protein
MVFGHLVIGDWNLFGAWDLEIGISPEEKTWKREKY